MLFDKSFEILDTYHVYPILFARAVRLVEFVWWDINCRGEMSMISAKSRKANMKRKKFPFCFYCNYNLFEALQSYNFLKINYIIFSHI